MKLKCIGGPNDGEYHECYKFREGDQVRIPKVISRHCDKVEISYTVYCMEITCYRDNTRMVHRFEFLRHENRKRDEIMLTLLTRTFK